MQTTMTANPPLADRRILILALALGAIAAGLIVAYLASRDSSGGKSEAVMFRVIVAAQDIPAGATIEGAMVEERSIPEEAVISSAVTRPEEVVGQVARYPIATGEQLSALRLVEPPAAKALSFQIPPGLRAFTLPVTSTTSPASLMAPGDFVDVIVSADVKLLLPGSSTAPSTGSAKELKAAVTILQNVQVLSVQKTFVDNGVPYDPSVRGTPPDDKSVSHVTLAVTPDQAQLLWLASQEGKVTLSLRAFGDDAIADLQPVAEPLRLQ